MPVSRSETAPAASVSMADAFDDLGDAVSDMRMFASVLDTLIASKLDREVPSVLLRPGVEGFHLFPIEAEEITFLALKADAAARKVSERFEALCAARYASKTGAA